MMLLNSQINIAIDLRPLVGGRRSGVEQYLHGLLPAMIGQAPFNIKFKLFLSSWREADLTAEWLKDPRVEVHRFFYSNRRLFAWGRLFNRPFLDQLVGGADVFFSPHFFLAPLSANCRSVITFHDLSFLRYPEFFSWRKRIWHQLEMKPRQQANRAQRLIADSASTRNDLVSLWGINPKKISVIYPGPGSGVSEWSSKNKEPAEIKRVQTRYRLPEKFILFLSALEPRKNILGILRAFDGLKSKKLIADDCYLVVAGEHGWREKEVRDFLRRSAGASRVRLAGQIDEDDKGLVYSLAKVFVYPSFFEGFGFPVLEAMMADVPVITSATSSLPEVAGGAAWLVNPYLVSDIAGAMQALVNNSALADSYVQKGRENVKKFSWAKTAQKTLELLVQTAQNKQNKGDVVV